MEVLILHRDTNGVFILPDSDLYTDPDNVQKGYTGTDAKSQCKVVKFHHIGTNISTKLGTVAIGIRIGIGIGIRVGLVKTHLKHCH